MVYGAIKLRLTGKVDTDLARANLYEFKVTGMSSRRHDARGVPSFPFLTASSGSGCD